MDRPITHKDIEVKGRTFRLNKIDARKGSYMLFKLMNILTPILKGINLEEIAKEDGVDGVKDNEGDNKSSFLDNINIADVAESLFSLPEEEFRYIQDNCLQAVEEVLSARNSQVLNENGNYGVTDVEFDIGLVMNLTVQSLIFNVSGFFNEDLLDSLVKGSTSSQLNSAM